MKEQEIEKHKRFTEFLESVVKDKSATGGDFNSIEDLTARYKNLKEVNKELVNEKTKIGKQGEDLSVNEKVEWNKLEKILYEETRKKSQIQAEKDAISLQISILEQDFEKGIEKKNQNSRDIGQIINSINNISNLCTEQQN